MTTTNDATTTEQDIVDAPPPPPPNGEVKEPAREAKPEGKPRRREVANADTDGEGRAVTKLSKPLADLQNSEDKALADWIRSLDVQESDIRIDVQRVSPQDAVDPRTGRLVNVKGHLKNYSHFIDEEFIKSAHGGGKYRLIIKKRNARGSYDYFKAKDIEIGGDPRTDDVPRNIPQVAEEKASSHATGSEPPSVVAKAMDVLANQLTASRERENELSRTPPSSDNSAMLESFRLMISQLQAQLQSRDREMAELRQALVESRNVKPAEDPFREKLLHTLMDGDSQRVTQIRIAHESEIRQLKENAREEERRLREAHERDKAYLVQSHERELATMKSSHDIALAAAKSSYEINGKVLEQQNRTLERELSELRSEVKELRAKKDKSVVDMAKELQSLKEALDIDGDSKDSSTVDKIVDVVTNPDALAAVQGIIRGPAPAAPPAAPQVHQQQAAPPQRERKIVDLNGQKFSVEPNGQMRPVRRKPVAQTGQLPQLPEDQVRRAVGLLEAAFRGGQDPEKVAESARSLVPTDILQAFVEVGPDAFMQKIAGIQMGTPLANQEGRNWVRKVAKALAPG